MKKEIYLEKDYNKIKRKYNIQKVNFKISPLDKFIKNELIIGHWNFDKAMKNIKKKDLAIVTGFSLSGKLHLGNKLTIDIANSLSKQGAKLFIPISDTEAILTRKSPEIINENLNMFIRDLIKIGIDIRKTEIYLHSNNKKVQYLLLKFLKILRIYDLKRIYGEKIDLPTIFAISNMMVDVFYPLENGYKQVVVVLGVDEIKHAQLVKLLSRRIKMREPSFLFTKILNGLKSDKMSKSKMKENILISDKPTVAKNKLVKNSLKRKFKSISDEPTYQIAKWHLSIPENKLDKLSKDLSHYEFIKYVANKLEGYFKNGFK